MPVWKAWTVESIDEKVVLILSAQRAFTSAMLPGIIAVLFSGYAWATATNYPLTTGWMIGLQGLFFLNLFLFIPSTTIEPKNKNSILKEARSS